MGPITWLKINLILVEIFLILIIVFFVMMSTDTIVDKVFAGILATMSMLNTMGITLENRQLMKRVYNFRLFMLIMFVVYFGIVIMTLVKKPNSSGVTDLKGLGDELIKAGFVCVMFTFWIGMSKQLMNKLPMTRLTAPSSSPAIQLPIVNPPPPPTDPLIDDDDN